MEQLTMSNRQAGEGYPDGALFLGETRRRQAPA